MIEMLVRGVGRDRDSGRVLVHLEGPNLGPDAKLALPLSGPDAHGLMHELRGHSTLRGQAFDLLDRVVTQLGATISVVELVPSGDGAPSARLRLERPEGEVELPVDLGQALALAVSRRVRLLVSEALVTAAETEAATAEASTPPTAAPVEVPAAFLRAFGE